jgi:RNA 3'-terminal phosphate cyclase-like protein
MLSGGHVKHVCNPQRSIGYYLEVLLCLAAFTKEPIKATLQGVTNNQFDPSVGIHSNLFVIVKL